MAIDSSFFLKKEMHLQMVHVPLLCVSQVRDLYNFLLYSPHNWVVQSLICSKQPVKPPCGKLPILFPIIYLGSLKLQLKQGQLVTAHLTRRDVVFCCWQVVFPVFPGRATDPLCSVENNYLLWKDPAFRITMFIHFSFEALWEEEYHRDITKICSKLIT